MTTFDSSRHQIGHDGKVYRRHRAYWLFVDGRPVCSFKGYGELHAIRQAVGEDNWHQLDLHSSVWTLEEVALG